MYVCMIEKKNTTKEKTKCQEELLLFFMWWAWGIPVTLGKTDITTTKGHPKSRSPPKNILLLDIFRRS